MRNVFDPRTFRKERRQSSAARLRRRRIDPRRALVYVGVASAIAVALLTFLDETFDSLLRSAPVTDRVTIVDGDTLQLGSRRIRLDGIDAPETGQSCEIDRKPYPCGAEATARLAAIVARQQVTCIERGRDQYGRTVAVCRLPDGTDIGRQMVRDGYALASDLGYQLQEWQARIAGTGLWRGEFVKPWEWRATR